MIPQLTGARVRGDLDVLSRAGLDLDDFIGEATDSVRRAVPWVGACVGTHDPATMMLTSARKYGALTAHNEHDRLFGIIEYGSEEPTSFRSLAVSDQKAIGMRATEAAEIDRSERMARLMRPHYGFADEARLLFRDGTAVWGCLAIFRGSDDPAFTADEVGFLGSLSESFARGVRSGILTRLAHDSVPLGETGGPAVVIVDARDEVAQISVGAEERLEQLRGNAHGGDPLSLVTSLVGAARRTLASPDAPPARARVRTGSGVWLLLHASPLRGAAGATGDVVVTIEEARPPEIVSLVVAAFGLTQRERDVTRLVLQGVETKEIASTLHVSAYTVQDHLKSVFDKAGVRSRRELISRVYFDQYVPRMGETVGATGWFAG
ncbi:helix-turn-helix transcriptional regulator [Agromyces luteolus]|uniref:LuxR family transcriptional regulator n=1 Tax=Agromyces luteolus TaxID=88373 RepID=A0A7C9MJK7_9MICO|nr:helix-turn-helix transcriptional regulator [Agromyces luteolus]MUN08718.1 LuxR family transcriptional regulator [Agromyces luteolus]GLK27261.1 helix-turn-helix transcriptional regulator [Agromyces luteolus]